MDYQQVLDYINQWITTNGNNEITADVLRPVLVAILDRQNLVTGNPDNLATTTQENLVAAINEVLGLIPPGSAGVKLYKGTDDPNVTPPVSFNYADFYMQVDGGNLPLQLFQYDGNNWIEVAYGGGSGGSQNLQQTAVNGNTFEDADNLFILDPTGFIAQNKANENKTASVLIDSGFSQQTVEGGIPRQTSLNYNDGLILRMNPSVDSQITLRNLSSTTNYIIDYPSKVGDQIPAFLSDLAGIGGSTNLSTTPSPTNVTINSDTGTDAPIGAVDNTNAGVMLPGQKIKLDGIATGATANQSDATTNAAIAAKQNLVTLTTTGSGTATFNQSTGALNIPTPVSAPVTSVNTKTGAVTLNQDEIPDGTTYKQYSATEKTKLSGIATGATANTGTVTTVSVVTANGVTGSVANAGTTPAITLSLGAITPTTVTASSTVTATNIDSTNKTDIAARALIASMGLYPLNFNPVLGVAPITSTTMIRSAFGSLLTQIAMLSAYVAKTANYTATETDFCIDFTGATTATLTLPTTFTANIMPKQYIVKNSGTGTITITAGGTVLFDGSTTKILNTQYATIHLIWDGTNYKVI